MVISSLTSRTSDLIRVVPVPEDFGILYKEHI